MLSSKDLCFLSQQHKLLLVVLLLLQRWVWFEIWLSQVVQSSSYADTSSFLKNQWEKIDNTFFSLGSKETLHISNVIFILQNYSTFFQHKKDEKYFFFAPANGWLANTGIWRYKIVVGNNQAESVMIVFGTLRTRLSHNDQALLQNWEKKKNS